MPAIQLRYRLPACRLAWLWLGVLLVLTPNLPLFGQVFVQTARQQGQGLLRERTGECFVITPKHVVGSEIPGEPNLVIPDDPIRVILPRRIELAALYQTAYPDDIAILKLRSPVPIECPKVWDSGSWRLGEIDDAVLLTATQGGSVRRRDVRVVQDNDRWIKVLPKSQDDRILQGHSGSLLRTNDGPAGMLQKVVADTGYVLRMDHITNVIGNFFVTARPMEYAADVLLLVDTDDELYNEISNGLADQYRLLNQASVSDAQLLRAAHRGDVRAACELADALAVRTVLFGKLEMKPVPPRRRQQGVQAISNVRLLRAGDCSGTEPVLGEDVKEYASSLKYARRALAKTVTTKLLDMVSSAY